MIRLGQLFMTSLPTVADESGYGIQQQPFTPPVTTEYNFTPMTADYPGGETQAAGDLEVLLQRPPTPAETAQAVAMGREATFARFQSQTSVPGMLPPSSAAGFSGFIGGPNMLQVANPGALGGLGGLLGGLIGGRVGGAGGANVGGAIGGIIGNALGGGAPQAPGGGGILSGLGLPGAGPGGALPTIMGGTPNPPSIPGTTMVWKVNSKGKTTGAEVIDRGGKIIGTWTWKRTPYGSYWQFSHGRKTRHMNVMNAHALGRANRRVTGFATKAASVMKHLGYQVSTTRKHHVKGKGKSVARRR